MKLYMDVPTFLLVVAIVVSIIISIRDRRDMENYELSVAHKMKMDRVEAELKFSEFDRIRRRELDDRLYQSKKNRLEMAEDFTSANWKK